MKQREIWMPHAGHLCVASHCRFHLNTYVNGVIVSTVGEYVPDSAIRKLTRESRGRRTTLRGDAEEADFGFEEIGYDRKYETMVFKAVRSKSICCPYTMKNGSEIDVAGYNTAGDAYLGHIQMLVKWGKKKVRA